MEMKQYVIGLLSGYTRMKQDIQALQYELEQIRLMDKDELIEAMTYGHQDNERIARSKLADKTPTIALNYEKTITQMLRELTNQFNDLSSTVSRLEFYMSQLEAHHASILSGYYFEGYSWRELQDMRGVTSKTLMKHRNEAIQALVQKYSSLHRIGLI